MDWRVMLTTFGVIFLAEIGDKTQIAAMTMAAEKKRPWEVFIGASLALVAVSAIRVIVGTLLSQYLPLEWIKRVAGAAFIVIGVLILFGKFYERRHPCRRFAGILLALVKSPAGMPVHRRQDACVAVRRNSMPQTRHI